MTEGEVRTAVYFDGFNMYHALNDLGEPFLKWLNLDSLSQWLTRNSNEAVQKIVFCTASYPDDNKRFRYNEYIRALKSKGVICVPGHHMVEPRSCRQCGDTWDKQTEKASDVNLALSIIEDGVSDIYDKAYLVTADTDQVATLQFFRRMFPSKSITVVTPPGRSTSSHLKALADDALKINKDFLEYCLFDSIVLGVDNAPSARRPREYDPPAGWVHPVHRGKANQMPKAVL